MGVFFNNAIVGSQSVTGHLLSCLGTAEKIWISPAGISILSPWLAMMITVPRRLTCVGLGSHLLCISILIIGIIRHGIGIPPNAFYKYFVFIFQKNQFSIVLAAIDCLVSHWPDICPNSLAKTSHRIKINICSLQFYKIILSYQN